MTFAFKNKSKKAIRTKDYSLIKKDNKMKEERDWNSKERATVQKNSL